MLLLQIDRETRPLVDLPFAREEFRITPIEPTGIMALLRMTTAGLYCEAGGFHIDPTSPVAQAVITHGHADHLTRGCRRYLTAEDGREIVANRLPPHAVITTVRYGETVTLNGVRVSLHPAGHVLGSAQVRVEHQGEVWVVTGDYRVTADPTCAAFEPVRCQTLVTESTFAHPYFQWPAVERVMSEIHDWWRQNQAAGKASFLYAYAFGKAQRVLAGLNADAGMIAVHPQVRDINRCYQNTGVQFPPHQEFDRANLEQNWSRTLLLMPPAARWQQPCPFHGHYATAFVSGWMLLADGPRQRHVSTGFALSDHADHAEIWSTIRATGAERVGVMHGYIDLLVAELQEQGYDAFSLKSARCKAPPEVVHPEGGTQSALPSR